MARIAVLIADDFEDSEYTRPVAVFSREGHEIVHVGLQSGKRVRGKKGAARAVVERGVGEVSPLDFDALLIPGGHSPGHLQKSADAVRFVRGFVESGRPVFAICHGPQLLAAAGVLQGRRVTAYSAIAGELERAGARFINAEVVEDGNLVCSRKPADLPAFIRAALAKLQEQRLNLLDTDQI